MKRLMMKFSDIFRSLTLFVVAVLSALTLAAAPSASSLIVEADSAYTRGDYAKALDSYLLIEKDGKVSPELYFNMGNAAYKAGQAGQAVLYYLRAKRLDPSNSSVDNNLNFIRSYVEDMNRSEVGDKKISVQPEQPSFWGRLDKSVSQSMLPNTWALLGVIAFLITLGCLACYIFSQVVLVKKIGFFGGLGMLAITIFFVVCSFLAAKVWTDPATGVITAYKVKLHKQAAADSEEILTPLYGGTEMSVIETVNNKNQKWYRLRLNSEVNGWLPASEFSVVSDI